MADYIEGAVKKPGTFKQAAAKAGQSVMSFSRSKKSSPGLLGKRAKSTLSMASKSKSSSALGSC